MDRIGIKMNKDFAKSQKKMQVIKTQSTTVTTSDEEYAASVIQKFVKRWRMSHNNLESQNQQLMSNNNADNNAYFKDRDSK
jgi:hypothetical protein